VPGCQKNKWRLNRSGTGCFIAVNHGNSGRQSTCCNMKHSVRFKLVWAATDLSGQRQWQLRSAASDAFWWLWRRPQISRLSYLLTYLFTCGWYTRSRDAPGIDGCRAVWLVCGVGGSDLLMWFNVDMWAGSELARSLGRTSALGASGGNRPNVAPFGETCLPTTSVVEYYCNKIHRISTKRRRLTIISTALNDFFFSGQTYTFE